MSGNVRRSSSSHTTRFLITAGVFSVIYIVVTWGFGMLGIMGPPMMIVSGLLGTLAGGVILMLYVAKTRRMWAFTIVGVLVGLVMTLSGHAALTLLTGVLAGIGADVVVRSGGFRDAKHNALGYAVFSLWAIGPWFSFVFQADQFYAEVADQMGADYASSMRALFSPGLIIILIVGQAVLAFIAGLWGMKMLDKHFRRAGVAS